MVALAEEGVMMSDAAQGPTSGVFELCPKLDKFASRLCSGSRPAAVSTEL